MSEFNASLSGRPAHECRNIQAIIALCGANGRTFLLFVALGWRNLWRGLLPCLTGFGGRATQYAGHETEQAAARRSWLRGAGSRGR